MSHRIFVVDDHAITRRGFAFLFSSESDMAICGEAASIAEALEGIPDADPDVVIVDISLADGSGIDLIEEIAERWPALGVLVVSMHEEALYAEQALRAGADGYVMKSEVHAVGVKALRRVLAGGQYLSDRMNEKLVQQQMNGHAGATASTSERLSNRELEAFELIGQGMTTSEIAERMHISTKTVGTYRRRIKEKLALQNGSELMQRAVRFVALKESTD